MEEEEALSPHQRPVVEVRHVGPVLVVRLLAPDVTSTYAHRLRAFLFSLADCGLPLRVILDLDEWPGIESHLGLFLRLYKTVKDGGGALRLCHVTPAARQAFNIVKFDRIVRLFPDVTTAVADWEG